MTITLLISFVLITSILGFINQKKFGKHPSGERLKRIESSPNYIKGKFRNLEHTPDLVEGVSYFTVLKDFFLEKNKNNKPPFNIPTVKTDLHSLSKEKNIIVWFGHSSYFIQVNGIKILVDPVFSGAASPVSFTTTSFKGTDVYEVADMPDIDYLILTHDHWDHLDYETILKIHGRSKKILTGLGVGEHLEYWGVPTNKITEGDWNDQVINLGDLKITVTTSRHFSGRGFKRAQTIWSSFVLEAYDHKVFLGGDSGYGQHFKQIGKDHGPFDLAILECGQYNEYWRYIHMLPEELITASKDLGAKRLIPVHWAKFSLAMHDWNEPIKRVYEASKESDVLLLTPKIGQVVNLKSNDKIERWW